MGVTCWVLLAALGLVTPCSAGEAEVGANPIRKIVDLLQDMQKELSIEAEKEKKLFEQFMCICDGANGEYLKEVEDGKAKVEQLTSSLQEESATRASLKLELKDHYRDKAEAEKDLDKATTIREKERAEFEAEHSQTVASISSLSKAIPALEASTGGASALMQADGGYSIKKLIESSSFLTTFDRQRILAFMSTESSADAPASGQIVGILKGMKDEMVHSEAEMSKSEKEASDGFDQLKAAKDQEIAVSSESIEAKEKQTGALAVSISQNTDGLEDAQEELKANQNFLASLKKQCAERKKQMAERTELRTQETAAIGEAIKVLNDDDALDLFKKTIPSSSLVQNEQPATPPRVAAMIRKFGFFQDTSGRSLPRIEKAQSIVQTASQYLNSNHLKVLLYTLNTRVRQMHRQAQKVHQGAATAETQDFGSIVKLIDKMITNLVTEMEDDEKKKEFCIAEIGKSTTEKGAKTEELGNLDSSMEESADALASLEDDIKALDRNIHELDKEVAQATEQRKKEHAEYVESLSMADAAFQLVGKAKNRLAKFYNPAAYKKPKAKELTMEEKIVASYGGAALAETRTRHLRVRRAAASFDDSARAAVELYRTAHGAKRGPIDLPELPEYKKSKKSGGVMELMGMVTHELEMDKQEMELTEKTAQKDYVELMGNSQVSRTEDAKSLVNKQKAKAQMEDKMQEMKETRKLTQEEWTTVHEYLIHLHAQCDLVIDNYDARHAARSSELESLKNAKSVMEGNPIGTAPVDAAGGIVVATDAPADAPPAEAAAAEPAPAAEPAA